MGHQKRKGSVAPKMQKKSAYLACLALFLGIVAGYGCRADIDARVEGNKRTKEKEGAKDKKDDKETKSLEEGLDVPRVRYQTRNVIRLRPSKELVDTGGEFSLVDIKHNETIISRIWSGDAFESDKGFRYKGGKKRTLFLYPTNGRIRNRLYYGKNKWSFLLENDTLSTNSTSKVILRDFDVFGHRVTSSRRNKQVQGGFQGWVGYRSGVLRSPSGGQMTTGTINMMNR